MKRPGDLQQPGILDRGVDPVEILGQVHRPGRRVELGRDPIGRHPRRVGEFGIVVVAQDLIEVPRGGAVRVDVRVGVEDRPARHLLEELAGRRGLLRVVDRASSVARLEVRSGSCVRWSLETDEPRGSRLVGLLPISARADADGARTAMNVVVTGGGTIAPIDDVRLIDQRLLGPVRGGDQRGVPGSRGVGLAHPRPHRPSSRSWRLARFDLDAADPAAELERLARLRERWLGVRDRLHLVPLETGTVADYAATLKRSPRVPSRSTSPSWRWRSPTSSPSRTPGKISSDAESLVVRCRPTPKVIRSVRDWAPSVYLVGFKLLSRASREELIRRAEAACRINRADLTVANDLQTLRQGRHTLHLVRPGAEPETLEPGDDLAERLVDAYHDLGRPGASTQVS